MENLYQLKDVTFNSKGQMQTSPKGQSVVEACGYYILITVVKSFLTSGGKKRIKPALTVSPLQQSCWIWAIFYQQLCWLSKFKPLLIFTSAHCEG